MGGGIYLLFFPPNLDEKTVKVISEHCRPLQVTEGVPCGSEGGLPVFRRGRRARSHRHLGELRQQTSAARLCTELMRLFPPQMGDKTLAQSAQMYHYQHRKQQMLSVGQ